MLRQTICNIVQFLHVRFHYLFALSFSMFCLIFKATIQLIIKKFLARKYYFNSTKYKNKINKLNFMTALPQAFSFVENWKQNYMCSIIVQRLWKETWTWIKCICIHKFILYTKVYNFNYANFLATSCLAIMSAPKIFQASTAIHFVWICMHYNVEYKFKQWMCLMMLLHMHYHEEVL